MAFLLPSYAESFCECLRQYTRNALNGAIDALQDYLYREIEVWEYAAWCVFYAYLPLA